MASLERAEALLEELRASSMAAAQKDLADVTEFAKSQVRSTALPRGLWYLPAACLLLACCLPVALGPHAFPLHSCRGQACGSRRRLRWLLCAAHKQQRIAGLDVWHCRLWEVVAWELQRSTPQEQAANARWQHTCWTRGLCSSRD